MATFTLEQARIDAANDLQNDYAAIFQTDQSTWGEQIAVLEGKKEELAKAKFDAYTVQQNVIKEERTNAQRTYKDGVMGSFKPVWEAAKTKYPETLLKLAEADTTINRFAFYVEVHRQTRDDGEQIVTIGEPQASFSARMPASRKGDTSNGNGGSRNKPLTVNGTQYESANAAVRAFDPDHQNANYKSCVSKLLGMGHTVVDADGNTLTK